MPRKRKKTLKPSSSSDLPSTLSETTHDEQQQVVVLHELHSINEKVERLRQKVTSFLVNSKESGLEPKQKDSNIIDSVEKYDRLFYGTYDHQRPQSLEKHKASPPSSSSTAKTSMKQNKREGKKKKKRQTSAKREALLAQNYNESCFYTLKDLVQFSLEMNDSDQIEAGSSPPTEGPSDVKTVPKDDKHAQKDVLKRSETIDTIDTISTIDTNNKPNNDLCFTSATDDIQSIEYRTTATPDEYNRMICQEINPSLEKYYHQRYDFFSRYDMGILLDEESWYSVTPEPIALHHAARLSSCPVVLDGFCGAGGNSIALAQFCPYIVANEHNEFRLSLAKSNASLYGVEELIEWVLGDYFDICKAFRPNTGFFNAAYLSPPWGGPDYKRSTYPLSSIMKEQQSSGKEVFQNAQSLTPNIAYYLPRNTSIADIISLLEYIPCPFETCEVEYNYMRKNLKACTVYFGALVQSCNNSSFE